MARENAQPPPSAGPVRVPGRRRAGARTCLSRCSRRLRHGFRLVPPPGPLGAGERSLRAAPGATIRCGASRQPPRQLGGGCHAPESSLSLRPPTASARPPAAAPPPQRAPAPQLRLEDACVESSQSQDGPSEKRREAW
ncbi:atherin-like [Heterocephalus glaber]|uniref:Atherin-like n=1 Tax=Heterocephalus glaber TaxID=10181 RepID=A0AAX6RE66_HETGA|nr:atherin-like [Heterocephalus glaber]